MRKITKKGMKAKVWKVFAQYIKLRDTDKDGFCSCCTCGKRLKWNDSQAHAGHFVPGRTNNILFDEGITHVQCSYCNLFLYGNQARYAEFMMKKYGYDWGTINEILARKHIPKKYTLQDLDELYNFYLDQVEILMKERL
jgi:hypothetical protein